MRVLEKKIDFKSNNVFDMLVNGSIFIFITGSLKSSVFY